MAFDLRQIKAFEAVAKHGGFSKASREVGLTQPTLSTHIRNLEETLGVRLFDRTGRSVSLTPAGKLLSGYAGRIVDLMEKTVQAIEGFTGQIRGNLHIDSSTVPGEYLLPRWLAGFHRRYPEVQVTLTISDSTQVLDRVARGEVPVGVTGSPADHSSLDSRLLCDDDIILAVSPELAESAGIGSRVDIGELAGVPLIRRETGSGTQRAVENALSLSGIRVDGLNWAANLGSTRAVVEGAIAGLGGAFLSALTVDREIAEGNLRAVEVNSLVVNRGFYLVTNSRRTLSPIAARFMEELIRTGADLVACQRKLLKWRPPGI
ncbi:MAG: selenium metabolism-associated LysR family transcriptional regulator [bacterium]|nr:selenium metabolism-associated LysR family transcriptional regulator [bacterium]MDT8396796.1 selenium metabolism-associated LysR family transcriptional regulator [bacterium]